jgi:cell division protease FtsH
LSDLEKVTKQARAMVSVFGLNERIGNITYYDSSGQNEYQFDKPYSERTAEVIDEEISKLIEGQYERAKELLRDNRDKLETLAKELLTKEVIFRDNLVAIFGERPWMSREERLAAHSEVKPEASIETPVAPSEEQETSIESPETPSQKPGANEPQANEPQANEPEANEPEASSHEPEAPSDEVKNA